MEGFQSVRRQQATTTVKALLSFNLTETASFALAQPGQRKQRGREREGGGEACERDRYNNNPATWQHLSDFAFHSFIYRDGYLNLLYSTVRVVNDNVHS